MPHLSAEAKHHILHEYAPRDTTRSFAALAARHAISGGKATVQRWHERWDGSPASLQRKAGSGKARALTATQVSRHVRAPILAANRAHRAIHYTELLPAVRQKTGAELSLRTLQRYGQEELGARNKHTMKRTADESECSDTVEKAAATLCEELWTDFC
jgi:transposase